MLKKETKRKIIFFLAPPILSFIIRFIYFTCKIKIHGQLSEKPNNIYACWHGELIIAPYLYSKLNSDKNKLCVLTSEHFDGKIIGNIFERIAGGFCIQGSTYKGGAKALLNTLKVLKTPNIDLAIAPDGPRGPRHSVAQGIVVLSQKLNVPIVAMHCKASSFWQFNSWDKMFLPKPFSKIDIFLSEPFFLNDLDLEQAKEFVKNSLLRNGNA